MIIENRIIQSKGKRKLDEKGKKTQDRMEKKLNISGKLKTKNPKTEFKQSKDKISLTIKLHKNKIKNHDDFFFPFFNGFFLSNGFDINLCPSQLPNYTNSIKMSDPLLFYLSCF